MKVCPKLNEEIASMIEVWKQNGDVRDVISISKLIRKNDAPGKIRQIIETIDDDKPTIYEGAEYVSCIL